jgi:AcrR family transcriptional regulator
MNDQMEEGQRVPSRGHARSEKRRHELIAAAYQVLAERGFEGLRVREVAAQVGVNIATLHYYFPTKESLVREVVGYLRQQFITITASLPDAYQDSPPERLRQIFVDLRYQFEQVPELFVVLNELHLHAQRDPDIHASLQQLNAGWQEHIEDICAEGVKGHFFREDLDVHQAASVVIALVKGISLQVASHLDIVDFEQTGDMLVRWFLDERHDHSRIHKEENL